MNAGPTKVVWWVIGIAVAAGAGIYGAGYGHRDAVVLGMAAPMFVTGASWTITTRTWARDQAALLPLMLRAFAVKVLFFVAYVVVMLAVFDLRLRPFVIGFTATFLATFVAEAYGLWRMMTPPVVGGVVHGSDGTQV